MTRPGKKVHYEVETCNVTQIDGSVFNFVSKKYKSGIKKSGQFYWRQQPQKTPPTPPPSPQPQPQPNSSLLNRIPYDILKHNVIPFLGKPPIRELISVQDWQEYERAYTDDEAPEPDICHVCNKFYNGNEEWKFNGDEINCAVCYNNPDELKPTSFEDFREYVRLHDDEDGAPEPDMCSECGKYYDVPFNHRWKYVNNELYCINC